MTHRPIIVLDIETTAHRALSTDAICLNEIKAGIEAPRNFKDPIKIAAHCTAALEREIDSMALQWFRGQIVAIAWKALDGSGERVIADLIDEKMLLDQFVADAGSLAWDRGIIAGFNVRTFDVPFITMRCAVHGLRLPGWWPLIDDRRSWWDSIIDARDWAPHAKGKLDDFLRAFGLPLKSGDGSQVSGMSHKELIEYSAQDIDVTTELMRLMAPTFSKLKDSSYDSSIR